MTWIRLDTNSSENEVVGDLASVLGVPSMQAFGHYVATLGKFGDHRVDGRADLVSDTTLEDWAKWRGRAGRFAQVFRVRCVQTEPGQKDAPGVVKGWWRQAKLLERQQRDAKKRSGGKRPPSEPAENPQQTPTQPPENPRGFNGGEVGEKWGYGNGTASTVTKRDPNVGASAPSGAPAPEDGPTLPESLGLDAQQFAEKRRRVKADLHAAAGEVSA